MPNVVNYLSHTTDIHWQTIFHRNSGFLLMYFFRLAVWLVERPTGNYCFGVHISFTGNNFTQRLYVLLLEYRMAHETINCLRLISRFFCCQWVNNDLLTSALKHKIRLNLHRRPTRIVTNVWSELAGCTFYIKSQSMLITAWCPTTHYHYF